MFYINLATDFVLIILTTVGFLEVHSSWADMPAADLELKLQLERAGVDLGSAVSVDSLASVCLWIMCAIRLSRQVMLRDGSAHNLSACHSHARGAHQLA